MAKKKLNTVPDKEQRDAWNDRVRKMKEAAREKVPGDVMEDGSVFAGISPTTGKKMFVMPRDHLYSSFNAAAQYARKLNDEKTLGHSDWRLPTKAELQVLYDNREKGALRGTFNQTGSSTHGWYWSSTPHGSMTSIWQMRFNDATTNYFSSTMSASVRYVR
jgi:hypothetical protein